MSSRTRLNIDIDRSIHEFKSVLREFRLKRKKNVFRGRGLEFDGYRDFTFDDNAEDIDWKSTLRAQKLLVRQYKEERDLKVMFLVDVGSNMIFGSTKKLKCEYAAELVIALADLMFTSEDRVGFFLFSDKIHHFIDCKRGSRHFQFFIDILSDSSNYGGKTNFDQALDFAVNYLDNSIFSVIIVSDFLNVTAETERKLTLLSSKFETIAIQIRDPLDITLPEINGEIILQNLSPDSEQIIINPKIIKMAYERKVAEQQKIFKQLFEKSGTNYLSLITNKPFAPTLATFLRERMRKF